MEVFKTTHCPSSSKGPDDDLTLANDDLMERVQDIVYKNIVNATHIYLFLRSVTACLHDCDIDLKRLDIIISRNI